MKYNCIAIALVLAVVAGGCAGVGGKRTAVPGMQQWQVRWGDGTPPSKKQKGVVEEEGAAEARRNAFFRGGWTCEGAGEHWLEVDWGRQAMVYGFELRWGEDVPEGYGVWVSADGKKWEEAYDRWGSQAPGGGTDFWAMAPRLVRMARVMARVGEEGGKATLMRMRVLGSNARPQARIDGVDAASTVALLDGDSATAWTKVGEGDAEILVDWGTAREMSGVQIDWAEGAARPEWVEVSASADGVQWTSLGEGPPGEKEPCDVWVAEVPRRVRWVKVSCRNPGEGFTVAGVSMRGGGGDAARAWREYQESVKGGAGEEGALPGIFAGVPPRWTVAAGLEEGSAEALVSTEGAWSAGRAAPSLWPVVRVGGRTLVPRGAAKSGAFTAGPGAPMPGAWWEWEGGLKLTLRVMAAEGGESWAEYALENAGGEAVEGVLGWVMRPLRIPPPEAGGGVAPVTHVKAGTGTGVDGASWQELRVNGAALFAARGERFEFAASAGKGGDAAGLVTGSLAGGKNVRDRDGLGGAAWTWGFALGAGETARAVLVAAPWPPKRSEKRSWPADPEGRFEDEWKARAWAWQVAGDGYAPQVERPGRPALARAQLSWVLGLHGEAETPEEALWRLETLLCAGRFDEARAAAGRWLERARETLALEDGEEVDSRQMAADRERTTLSPEVCGQFLFGVMETWRFAGDNAFLEEAYPVMRRMMLDVAALTEAQFKPSAWRRVWRWLRPWRVKPPEVGPAFGLVADRAAGEGGEAVHQTAAQLWALAGWKELRKAAERLGFEEDAAWAESQYRALREAVRRAVGFATIGELHPRIPPSVEAADGPGGGAAAAVLFWPCGEGDLFPAAMVQNTLDGVYERFLRWTAPDKGPGAAEGGAGGGLAWMGDVRYLTAMSRMGHADYAREVLFDLCGRCEPAEWGALPAFVRTRAGSGGAAAAWRPDVQTAALFFLAMRQMVVCEDGGKLHLLCGIPPEWVQQGEGFKVASAPTAWGALDLEAMLRRRMFRVKVGGTARPPEGCRLWWPLGEPPERVMLDRVPVAKGGWDVLGMDLPAGFAGTVDAFFEEDVLEPREP